MQKKQYSLFSIACHRNKKAGHTKSLSFGSPAISHTEDPLAFRILFAKGLALSRSYEYQKYVLEKDYPLKIKQTI